MHLILGCIRLSISEIARNKIPGFYRALERSNVEFCIQEWYILIHAAKDKESDLFDVQS